MQSGMSLDTANGFPAESFAPQDTFGPADTIADSEDEGAPFAGDFDDADAGAPGAQGYAAPASTMHGHLVHACATAMQHGVLAALTGQARALSCHPCGTLHGKAAGPKSNMAWQVLQQMSTKMQTAGPGLIRMQLMGTSKPHSRLQTRCDDAELFMREPLCVQPSQVPT